MNRNSEAMKLQRRRDFDVRAAGEPGGSYVLEAGGEVVTIHPLADEIDLLSKLGVRPEQCTSVDAYWSVRGDVVFLQINVIGQFDSRAPGLYARVASYPPKHVNLVVFAEVPCITRAVLETAARELLVVGWDHVKLDDHLVKLA